MRALLIVLGVAFATSAFAAEKLPLAPWLEIERADKALAIEEAKEAAVQAADAAAARAAAAIAPASDVAQFRARLHQEIEDKKLCKELTGGPNFTYPDGHDWAWCLKGLGYQIP